MFKGNKKHYYILGAIFIAVIVLHYFQPKPINWSRTYFKNDKIPFGCFAIFNLLDNNFADAVETNRQTLYVFNENNTATDQSLVLVNETIDLSKLDTKSMLDFIGRGNKVLLTANNFGKHLTDTLHMNTRYNYAFSSGSIDSLLKRPAFAISYVQPKNNSVKEYSYPEVANESYFSEIDTALFKIVAVNKKNKPVIIKTTIGSGELILCSLPDVFGNLFIVDHKNRYFTYTLLSMVKNKTFIWDEFYKTYNVQQKGILQFIFNNEPLYMAYCILILGLVIFMIFEMKRRQRLIPVIRPLENTTLQFVDVISHVYFNSRNHKHIAEETIQYFYFDVRKKFNVRTHEMNAEFYTSIHKLSGIALDEVQKLFSYCENIKKAPSLTQYDLLELNDRINNFKQKSIR